MSPVPKLTTTAACRVARLNRDRFNEHVAAGHFNCAPETVPGRARLFDPDDMVALRLFSDLMEDGYNAFNAGRIACGVGEAARKNPDAESIAYVKATNGLGHFCDAGELPPPSTWALALFRGFRIKKASIFNVDHLRRQIAEGTDEERSIIGPDD